VLVGPDQSEHAVHAALLCEKSPYFAAATKQHWKEGQEGRVPLSTDDPAAFGLYVQWIYRNRIFSFQDAGDTGGNLEEVKLLVEAFVLGEKLQDQDFRDAVLDSLIHAVDTPDGQDVRWYPTATTIDRAYKGTPEGSPLRKLLVDMHFFHGRREWLNGAVNIDFLRDLARDLLDDRGNSFSPKTDRTTARLAGCSYHGHGADHACYSGASQRLSGAERT
jgi:hypothetical protein